MLAGAFTQGCATKASFKAPASPWTVYLTTTAGQFLTQFGDSYQLCPVGTHVPSTKKTFSVSEVPINSVMLAGAFTIRPSPISWTGQLWVANSRLVPNVACLECGPLHMLFQSTACGGNRVICMLLTCKKVKACLTHTCA